MCAIGIGTSWRARAALGICIGAGTSIARVLCALVFLEGGYGEIVQIQPELAGVLIAPRNESKAIFWRKMYEIARSPSLAAFKVLSGPVYPEHINAALREL